MNILTWTAPDAPLYGWNFSFIPSLPYYCCRMIYVRANVNGTSWNHLGMRNSALNYRIPIVKKGF